MQPDPETLQAFGCVAAVAVSLFLMVEFRLRRLARRTRRLERWTYCDDFADVILAHDRAYDAGDPLREGRLVATGAYGEAKHEPD